MHQTGVQLSWYFIPPKKNDDQKGRKKLLTCISLLKTVRKKRVHMEEEGNSLLLRFEDRETETARRYPKEKKKRYSDKGESKRNKERKQMSHGSCISPFRLL